MKIIHLHQQHKLPFGIKPIPEVIDATVQSQFMVAQEIKKRPRCPVLVEGLFEDVSDADSLKLSQVVKIIFPRSFPTDFNDLTPLQKNLLYDKGAVLTLFYLGEIPSIYKSIHKEASEAIERQISEGFYAQIFKPRETEAIACAKEAAIKHFKKLDGSTVIIVFGGGHDFKPYCDEERFEYEVIKCTGSLNSTTYSQEHLFIESNPQENLSLDFLEALRPKTTSSSKQYAACKQLAPEQKKSDFDPVSKMPAFFTSTTSSTIPTELQEPLKNGGIENDYIKKNLVTLEQIIDLHNSVPWVIGALRCYNIRQGIYNHYIDIEQLSRLTEEQVTSIEHKFEDAALQSQVAAYIALNRKQI
jgi:hypothetical protein